MVNLDNLSYAKFPMGQLVATAGVHRLMASGLNVLPCLMRHLSGDWGELCDEDKAENELSLKEGYRLLSAYTVGGVKIWIITESDRSVSTILLPSEY